MAKIGYIRVSSTDQNPERQLQQLQKLQCLRIFQDSISGATMDRPALKEMLAYIRKGDTVIVTELDRLGRNSQELTEILDEIRIKGASFEALNLPSFAKVNDDNLRSLMNALVIELFKYFAESERKRIRERQRQGIEIAKKAGKYKGKAPLFHKNSPRLQHAFLLLDQGYSVRRAAEMTNIAFSTFKRYKRLYYKREDTPHREL